MKDKLKKHFPSLQYYESIPRNLNQQLTWFMADNGHVIGIDPIELNDKELALLHMFLQPLEDEFPPMTEEEKYWSTLIESESEVHDLETPFRFIYFQFPKKQIQPTTFKDAINQLFERDVVILWKSKTEGIIVDFKEDDGEELISLSEIIDVLMSDLYINIRFFVGPYQTSLRHTKHHVERLVSQAETVFSYSENNVVAYVEAIPFMLIEQLTPTLKEDLNQLVSQEFKDDPEFLNMMEVFLKSDLNVSVAAKKLYMHRNSLQYRIEKFHEKTGLDIRKFHHALSAYLALLIK